MRYKLTILSPSVVLQALLVIFVKSLSRQSSNEHGVAGNSVLFIILQWIGFKVLPHVLVCNSCPLHGTRCVLKTRMILWQRVFEDLNEICFGGGVDILLGRVLIL